MAILGAVKRFFSRCLPFLDSGSSEAKRSKEAKLVIITNWDLPFATAAPSASTVIPTAAPTVIPTAAPTVIPTAASTVIPTAAPTVIPTAAPTVIPTAASTIIPTAAPTLTPATETIPTTEPIEAASAAPAVGEESDIAIEHSFSKEEGSFQYSLSTAAENATYTDVPGDTTLQFVNSVQAAKIHRTSKVLKVIDGATGGYYSGNGISTAKYSLFTFFPKTIFFFCTRFSHLFFLLVAFLQTVPEISDSNGQPTYLTPLFIVAFVFMVKEAWEDLQRHKSDTQENKQLVSVFKGGKLVVKCWDSLQVGDVVKVHAGEYFPADLILLQSSDEYGACNVETKNLDGEANLKAKYCIPEIAGLFRDEAAGGRVKMKLSCELPKTDLYSFSGVAEVPTYSNSHTLEAFQMGKRREARSSTSFLCTVKAVDLSIHQLLLRGTSLVNTNWCLGCVAYCGRHSRIFMNANTKARQKWSRLEKTFNQHVVVLVLIVLLLCLIVSLGYLLLELRGVPWYLGYSQSESLSMASTPGLFYNFVVTYGTILILFAQFVPLELVMFWEIIRFMQGLFIQCDVDLRYGTQCTSYPAANASRLIEEMGNVSHVFSDKTGTLTENVMQLQCLCVGQRLFGLEEWNQTRVNQIERSQFVGSAKPTGMRSSVTVGMRYPTSVLNETAHTVSSLAPCAFASPFRLNERSSGFQLREKSKNVCLNCVDLMEALLQSPCEEQEAAKYLLMALGLCHSVLCSRIDASDASHGPPTSNMCNKAGDDRVFSPDVYVESLGCFVRVFPEMAPEYTGSSPDELALVSTATSLGFEFRSRPDMFSIEVLLTSDFACRMLFGEVWYEAYERWLREATLQSRRRFLKSDSASSDRWVPVLRYKVLDVLDFDNDRKRMSVIVEDANGAIIVLTKGADEAMVPVAAPHQEASIAMMNQSLSRMATNGLRTLMLGYRIMDRVEFEEFRRAISSVRSVTDASARFSSMALLVASVEAQLTLLGCTGIEDKLQRNVEGAIQDLRDASIKVWMLTGDKVETAINIGYASNLLSEDSFNAVINSETTQSLTNQLFQFENYLKAAALLAQESDTAWWNEIRWEKVHEELYEMDGASLKDMDAQRFTSKGSRDSVKLENVEDIGSHTVVQNLGRSLSESMIDRDTLSTPMRGIQVSAFASQMDPIRLDDERLKTVRPKPFVSVVQGETRHKMLSRAEIHEALRIQTRKNKFRGHASVSGSHSFSMEVAVMDMRRRETSGYRTKRGYDRYKMNLIESLLQLPVDKDVPTESHLATGLFPIDSNFYNRPVAASYSEFCITITGKSLELILRHPYLRARFFRLARQSYTVIASRVTPKQKALLIQQHCAFNPRSVCLAIGDGANDVGMILAAHVGVGIAGVEGSQAARAADFAIGRFSHLRRLLFAHGSSAMRRNSMMMYLLLFKNVSFSFAEFVFAFYSGLSGLDIYNTWIKQLYSILFIALPLITYSIFDQHLPYDTLVCGPLLYMLPPTYLWPFNKSTGFKSCMASVFTYCKLLWLRFVRILRACFRFITHSFAFRDSYIAPPADPPRFTSFLEHLKSMPLRDNNKKLFEKINLNTQFNKLSRILHPTSPVMWFGSEMFWVWILYAFYAAAIQVSVLLFGLQDSVVSSTNEASSGQLNLDLITYGQAVYFHNVITSNVVLLLMSNSIYLFTFPIILSQIALFILVWVVVSSTPVFLKLLGAEQLFATFQIAHNANAYYLSLVISVSITLLPLFILISLHMIKYPTVSQIVLERLKKGVYDVMIGRRKGKGPTVLVPSLIPPDAHRGFAFQYEGNTKEQRSVWEIIIGKLLWESKKLKHS